MKKGLICVLVCILVSASTIVLVSGDMLPEKVSHLLTTGNILYVGGSGPNNYTKIQDAINDASNGDTVYVFNDSSPYKENLIIEKSIYLIGENKNSTIIDGNEKEEAGADVIHIQADGVTIQGFTIQNSSLNGSLEGNNSYCGIDIKSQNNIIRDNIIRDNYFGIQIGEILKPHTYSKFNLIEGNIITDNAIYGILISWADNNIIQRNIITFNKISGVELSWRESKNNLITLNKISFNGKGVVLNTAYNSTIEQNTISDNNLGISVEYSNKNNVIENNIFNNEKNAQIESATIDLIRFLHSNIWDGNYWGEPKNQVVIPGTCYLPFMSILLGQGISFSFNTFDYHPAQKPYDIPG